MVAGARGSAYKEGRKWSPRLGGGRLTVSGAGRKCLMPVLPPEVPACAGPRWRPGCTWSTTWIVLRTYHLNCRETSSSCEIWIREQKVRVRDDFCDKAGSMQLHELFFRLPSLLGSWGSELFSDLKSEIDKLATEYISNARTLSSEEKLGLLKQIQEAYGKCKEFGDDKVQLAMQTYEMVDKHIRRLDTDLARFEADLKEKQIESSDYDSSSSKGKKKGRAQKEKKAARARSKGKNSDEEAPKTAQKKLKLVRTTEYGMPSVTFGNVHPSDVLDMPVDPNEPTYCLCHQVSYGEMIGCDNPDCSIEWFHFACVGLTTKPRGKWFCPRCSQERKKK
ncbi:inhibitor of growth protein 4 isoform X2 [Dromaius novaehollandiae]|uniref:inhibitor of growth protein 4 isoform X2 n=1 Tax=Dromaius novaehollandiae TaxID=8790 RepID=UPI00311F98D6